jgi:hypothetical protein
MQMSTSVMTLIGKRIEKIEFEDQPNSNPLYIKFLGEYDEYLFSTQVLYNTGDDGYLRMFGADTAALNLEGVPPLPVPPVDVEVTVELWLNDAVYIPWSIKKLTIPEDEINCERFPMYILDAGCIFQLRTLDKDKRKVTYRQHTDQSCKTLSEL